MIFTITLLACGFAPQQAEGTEDPSSARSVTEETLPKVVKIFGAGGLRGLPAYGTGFLISPRGHVATAWNHVLDADPNILVVLDDGRRLTCKLLAADPARGLAVLEPGRESLNLPHFDPASFAPAESGDRVLAFSKCLQGGRRRRAGRGSACGDQCDR